MLPLNDSPFRTVLDLSGFWNFQVDWEAKGEENRYFLALPSPRRVAVPGAFNDQFLDGAIHNHMGMVWYERDFALPREFEGKRLFLRFGAANYRAKVWLNGTLLGEHEGSYIPFEFEITNVVHREGTNRLGVRVDYLLSWDTIPQNGVNVGHWAGSGPKFPPMSADHFPYGGLVRPVVIYATGRSRFRSAFVDTDLEGDTGKVHVQAEIDGEASRCLVEIEGVKETCAPENGLCSCELEVPKVEPWSPENPKLYPLTLTLLSGKKEVDGIELSIGIRTVRVEGERLLLNGKPVILRGTSKHEDFYVEGASPSRAVLLRDMENLRYIGGNSMRTSHYPHSEEWMELCDREGILVIDECPATSIWHTAPGVDPASTVTPKTKEAHKRAIVEMMRRDYNHPSVIIWSLSNEPNGTMEISRDYFREMIDFARTIDKNRPITIVGAGDSHDDLTAPYVDVICTNVYRLAHGLLGDWEEVKRQVAKQVDGFHERYNKPVIVTEFGVCTFAGFHSAGSENWTEEYQVRHLVEYLNIFEERPFIVGIHIWVLADFKSQQHFGRTIFNRKGLFTRDREPKLAAHVIAKRWRNGGLLAEEG